MTNKISDKITSEKLLKLRFFSTFVFVVIGVIIILFFHNSSNLLLLCACVCVLGINHMVVKKLLDEVNRYSDALEKNIENIMLNRKMTDFSMFEESILSKNQMQLKKLCESINRRVSENQAEKETLQELISDLAHQVKTPLANVVLYTNALRKENLTLEKKQYYLDILLEQVQKLDFFMNNLLKMSRLEVGIFTLEPQLLPVQETLASAIGGIAIKAEEKNIEINVDCREDIFALHDKKWTCEAIENILDNAVKYTLDNGKINIKVTSIEIYILIEISDTGIGIHPDEIPKIFQRFYRGKNVKSETGVGIGLYLVREILRMEKGFIMVESKLGKGSKFSIYLLRK